MAMRRLKALDLFCGAGGVCAGLQRAGFDVVGVDIEPQPDYPGQFVLGDALQPPARLADFDFIWASPPCQGYSVTRNGHARDYPLLIEPLRDMLAGHPLTCIENVVGAPLRRDLVLTLPMFGNFTHPHKRLFELSFFCWQPFPVKTGDRACVMAAGSSRATGFYHKRRNWPMFSTTHIRFIAETQPGFYRRHFANLVGASGHGYPDTAMGQRRKSLGLCGTTTPPNTCLLYTSPSPRDRQKSRMPSSA